MNAESAGQSPLGTFDLCMAQLKGLPDVTESKPSPVQTFTPVREQPQTWTVQTLRHRERGDTVFLTYVGPDGHIRIALPPAVAEKIARQRDALTTAVRKRIGRERAAADKAAGKVPGFLRNGKSKAH
jgi:hypothetical protein